MAYTTIDDPSKYFHTQLYTGNGSTQSITNDANAAARGEKRYGVATEMNNAVLITLGTGLGSGIFTGGLLLYGMNSLAGEMGHISIAQNGRACSCGLKG